MLVIMSIVSKRVKRNLVVIRRRKRRNRNSIRCIIKRIRKTQGFQAESRSPPRG